ALVSLDAEHAAPREVRRRPGRRLDGGRLPDFRPAFRLGPGGGCFARRADGPRGAVGIADRTDPDLDGTFPVAWTSLPDGVWLRLVLDAGPYRPCFAGVAMGHPRGAFRLFRSCPERRRPG